MLQRTILVGGALAALAVGGYALRDTVVPPTSAPVQPAEVAPPAPAPESLEAVASEALEAGAPETAEEQEREAPPDTPAPASAPPRFDVVRVGADGGALVAGAATPGAVVILRVDGEEVAETVADAAGQFVLIFLLDPADDPQTMTLESRGGDGQVVAARDTVILSPRPALALAARDDMPDAPPPADTLPEPAAGGAAAPGPAAALHAPREPAGAGAPSLPSPPDPAATPVAPAREDATEGEHDADPPAVTAPEPAPPADAPPAADELPSAAQLATGPRPQIQPPPARPASRPPGEGTPALAPPERGPAAPAPTDLPPDAPPASADTLPAIDAPTAAAPVAAAPSLNGPRPTTAEQAALLPPAFVLRQSGAVEVAGRAPADAVVIDAISYSEAGAVQISGRAGRNDPQARVQLYLDNQPLALAQADQGAWSVAVPDLAPGVYTLRADQLAADGRVETRFETPFQRAAPEDILRAPARPGREAAEASDVQLITVQPGNSLWRISREHYGEGVRYVQIYQANIDQIRNPDLIYPGQIFVLPQ